MNRAYSKPAVVSDRFSETSALSCGKTPDGGQGSRHYSSAYDTFTGHFGGGMGASESLTGSVGVGFGPGGTSFSYPDYGLCANWVTYSS